MCSRCEILTAENQALRGEVEEWRRQAAEEEARVDAEAVMVQWRGLLAVDPWVVRAGVVLTERAGRVVTFHALAAASTPRADHDPWETAGITAKVAVCKLRAALRAAGLDVQIETVRGIGYRLPPADAERLRRRIEASVVMRESGP